MASSTEKRTIIGRAVARVRDRYRDNHLKNHNINNNEYALVLRILDEVKVEHNRITAAL